MDSRWIALHAFYHGDMDTLVTESVRYVAELQRRGVVREFFFVRYWNGGPHLRLRLSLGDAEGIGLAKAVRQDIEDLMRCQPGGQMSAEAYNEHAGEMLSAGKRIVNNGQLPYEEAEPLQKGDSVQVRPYSFDSDRYGNTQSITEGHFCRSSEMAAFIVAQTMGQPKARLTLALHLAAAAVPAMGLNPNITAALFERVRSLMIRMFDAKAECDAKPISRFHFEHSFDRLDHDLLYQLQNPLPLPGQDSSVNKLLRFWEHELRHRYVELQALLQHGELRAPPEYIIMDYVHMLNNRLGIIVKDELTIWQVVASALHYADDCKRC
jgi:thiopeptide-type bacteriocin biosynthesis protein